MRASPELRNNKGFMMQVMKLDLSLYACTSVELQQDLDLVTMVFASPHGSRIVPGCKRGYTCGHPKFLLGINDSLEERVRSHDALVETIFFSVLNQGYETSSNYFKLIGEYLGVQISLGTQEIPRARCANKNLSKYLQFEGQWT